MCSRGKKVPLPGAYGPWMMSIGPETSTRTTGARRAHREARDRAAARAVAQRPPTRYEPYLDGLFTYCLSVLCDHDAATAALGGRARARRAPTAVRTTPTTTGPGCTRWHGGPVCASSPRPGRNGRAPMPPDAHAVHGAGTEKPRAVKAAAGSAAAPRGRGAAAQTGTRPARLAGGRRHHARAARGAGARRAAPAHRPRGRRRPRHDPAAARELLASAACEVERTRAALAVVETGGCPSVARLTGDQQLVLQRHPAPRTRPARRRLPALPPCRRACRPRPLARHQRHARRAARARSAARRPAVLRWRTSRAHVAPPPASTGGAFPMDPKDRAARRDRLRARAVTTTVVATVVAAPVLALWAAYRGAPLIGEGSDGRSVGASEAQGHATAPSARASATRTRTPATPTRPGARPGKGKPTRRLRRGVSGRSPGAAGRGRALSVAAANDGDTTLITLRATGDSPGPLVRRTGADWLYLSRSSGTLEPGESSTIKVYVDHLREPAGPWTRAGVAGSGGGRRHDRGLRPGAGTSGPPGADPTGPGPGPPRPTAPPPEPTPDPSPTGPDQPDPTPTPTDQAPTDPPGPTTPPGDGGGAPPPASSRRRGRQNPGPATARPGSAG